MSEFRELEDGHNGYSFLHQDMKILLQETQSTLVEYLDPSANLEIICRNLENSGLKKEYVNALLNLVIRKKIIAGLWILCGEEGSYYNKKIQKTIVKHIDMMTNSSDFNTIQKGSKNFRKYGSLSLAYTNFSLVNLVQQIAKDAGEISRFYTKEFEQEIENIYGEFENNREDFISMVVGTDPRSLTDETTVPFQNVSFERLAEALEQDILGVGLPADLLEEFKILLDFENLSNKKSRGSGASKTDFFDGLFCYFSQIDDIKLFAKQWGENKNNFRENAKTDFLIKFYNEPNVNPRLIGMSTGDLGTKKFAQKREERGNQKWGGQKRKDIIIDGENSDQFY